ncbi:MAG: N-acetylneuraminate synthase [Brevundimonas sp.]|nr:MAG: N-acetylneuraminate synthase [Brevundimonas sp.]
MQGQACEIIAEAGVNHDGREDRALALVEAAARAGADVVKFQTFDPDEIAAASAPTAGYQARAGQGADQRAMLRTLALPREAFRRIRNHADACGIAFLSTPFDIGSARFLVDDLGMARVKLGSGELTNLPYLLKVARLGRPLILSTGMATLLEVEQALGVVAFAALAGTDEPPSLAAFAEAGTAPEAAAILAGTIVMQCVTEYPAPPDQANLRVMDAYAAMGVRPGYSDHTPGVTVALAAAARGAVAIEKHLTLDKSAPGPDHAASLEPDEMAALIDGVRIVTAALGDGIKAPVGAERANMTAARRSLVAARPIAEGEILIEDAITARRPGNGLPPSALWSLLSTPAARAYAADEAIEP